MDPQQRLTLELGWEALEDAGIAPSALTGTQTGIFVGAIADDYAELAPTRPPRRRPAPSPARSAASSPTGVSYALGLRGPSMTVDTGQSSSLVAVHLACESLRRGESTLALAGGVSLNLGPRPRAGAGEARRAVARRALLHLRRARQRVRARRGRRRRRAQAARARGRRRRPDLLRHPRQRRQQRRRRRRADGTRAGRAGAAAASAPTATPGSRPATCSTSSSTAPARRWATRSRPAALGAVLGAGRAARRPLVVGSAKTNVGHLEGGGGHRRAAEGGAGHRARRGARRA